MADDKKTVTTSAAESKPNADPKPAVGKLARASESGDPSVQHALAELQSAQMNRAALDVEAADIKAADDLVTAKQKILADLGYE